MLKRKEHYESKKPYVSSVVIVTLLRILLQMGIPVYYIDAPVDDMLLINYASSILEGKWLGEYCVTTLNKNPFFSIFLALNNKLNIPYMLGVILCYTLACLFFLLVVGHLVKKWIAIVMYVYILYSPAMFDSAVTQRVYRCSIIPTLVLIIVSCALKIYFERNENIKKIVIWSALEGIAFSMFYLTREDSAWLYPFVIGAIGVTIVKLLLDNKGNISVKGYVKKIVVLFIPVFLCVISINILKLKNYKEYGIYTTTDFNKTAFADMGKSILQIESDEKIEHIWVTRSTIEKLYQVSPTFAILKPELDNLYDQMDAWGTGTIDGEIEKDYIIWAIRSAASATGIYADAKEANEFFTKVNEEIEIAFQEGKLQKSNAIVLSNLGRPLYLNEIKEVLKSALENFVENITYSNKKCILPDGIEYSNDVNKAESVIGNNIILKTVNSFSLKGWIFSENDNDTISMMIKTGSDIIRNISFEDSQDVYDAYINMGDFNNAKKCRFSVQDDEDLSNCILEIYLNNEMIFQGEVSEFLTFQHENIHFCIDENTYTEETNYSLNRAEKNIKIANFIIKIYQITGAAIGFIAFLMYIIEFVMSIAFRKKHKKTKLVECIINTGFLLALLTNYLVVSINYFDAFDREGAMNIYTAGTYPLWQVFVCLSLICGKNIIKNIFLKMNASVAEIQIIKKNY